MNAMKAHCVPGSRFIFAQVQCSLLSQGSIASSQEFDRTVVSPALLLAIDINSLH